MVDNTVANSDPSSLRAINRARVLQIIMRGPASRAEIARLTGLSQPTVGAIASDLIDRRLVIESEGTSTTGRPPILLTVDPTAYVVIGVKLMEDHLVGAVTDLFSEVIASREISFADSRPGTVVEALATLTEQLLDATGHGRDDLLGVGIGVAGVVDGENGVSRYSPFLGWSDVPLGQLAEEALGVPVLVENDVNTLGLTESLFGAGQVADDFILVTLGRGVGLAVVSGGELYRGHRGGAAEIGHLRVSSDGPRCECGNVGCLEAVASEPALLERTRRLLGRPDLSADEIYTEHLDDPVVREVFEEGGQILGSSIGNVVNLFAPELVVVSGEGLRAGSILLDSLKAALEAAVFGGLRDSYSVAVEPFDDAAWARGAASLVLGGVFGEPRGSSSARIWDRQAVG